MTPQTRAVFADYEQEPLRLTSAPVVAFDNGHPRVLAVSRLEAVSVWDRPDLGVFVGLIQGSEDPEILRTRAQEMLAEAEADAVADWARH